MRIRINRITAVFISALLLTSLAACSTSVKYDDDIKTIMFTDSAGRDVQLPENIERVAPSGSVATIMLAILCPERLVCVSSTPSSEQYKYLPPNLMDLPTTGQLYGSKSTINYESLINADPQIIIDLGDRKDNIASDMNALQKTTGIATIYLEADLPHIADAYRALGEILGVSERAEAIASFIDKTMTMATENADKISESDKKTVMYTSGTTGLNTNPFSSVQAQVIEIVGAKNAVIVDDVSNAGGGNPIGLEQLYNFAPDVILFSAASLYESVSELKSWSGLSAVKNGTYYEIPGSPYNWMSNPPSINMVLGVWWLGNILYPDIYDYDMVKVTRDIYKLFWGYDMTEDEAKDMLANSTLK